MERPTVVIANSDSTRCAVLARGLHEHARGVIVASSSDELRSAIREHCPQVVIADLETVPLGSISGLRDEFNNLTVVCTHRVPDEQMWAASLDAGASDCCSSGDVEDVVRAALGIPYRVRTQAA
ncbi:MAG: hypothetical protein JO041_01725 [Acidobacteria bacterium]|nr:hypothetical protein [Acidobacteriota bacterium]